MSVDIRLPNKRGRLPKQVDAEPKHIVSPGDVITEDIGYMRFVCDFSINFLLCEIL